MDRKIYKVAIVETYRKVVAVPAKSEDEAHDRVYDAWYNTEVLLDDDNFQGIEVFVLGENDDKNLLMVEGEE